MTPSFERPRRSGRSPGPLILLAVVVGVAVLVATGCGGDGVEPTPAPAVVRAVLEPTAPVSAAVVRLEGVRGVSLEGGRVFTRTDGGALVAVLLLDEPGALRFEVEPDGTGTSPTATLLEVADAESRIVDLREGHRVRFGS